MAAQPYSKSFCKSLPGIGSVHSLQEIQLLYLNSVLSQLFFLSSDLASLLPPSCRVSVPSHPLVAQTHNSGGPKASGGSRLAKSVPTANCLGALPTPKENLPCEHRKKSFHTANQAVHRRKIHTYISVLSHKSSNSSPCLSRNLEESKAEM